VLLYKRKTSQGLVPAPREEKLPVIDDEKVHLKEFIAVKTWTFPPKRPEQPVECKEEMVWSIKTSETLGQLQCSADHLFEEKMPVRQVEVEIESDSDETILGTMPQDDIEDEPQRDIGEQITDVSMFTEPQDAREETIAGLSKFTVSINRFPIQKDLLLNLGKFRAPVTTFPIGAFEKSLSIFNAPTHAFPPCDDRVVIKKFGIRTDIFPRLEETPGQFKVAPGSFPPKPTTDLSKFGINVDTFPPMLLRFRGSVHKFPEKQTLSRFSLSTNTYPPILRQFNLRLTTYPEL